MLKVTGFAQVLHRPLNWSKPVAGLLLGGGTSTDPIVTDKADKNFAGFWLKSTATSGTVRGIYLRLYIAGASGDGGEAARFFTTIAGATVGGGVHGAHISAMLDATGQASGLMVAVRATLGADAATKSVTGTMAALQVESFFATGNTLPSIVSFIRVVDTGAVKIGNLLELPNVSNGTIFAAHTTQTLSHSIKIITANGTAYYIMCTDAATNRS